jgi:hypothetical protein
MMEGLSLYDFCRAGDYELLASTLGKISAILGPRKLERLRYFPPAHLDIVATAPLSAQQWFGSGALPTVMMAKNLKTLCGTWTQVFGTSLRKNHL